MYPARFPHAATRPARLLAGVAGGAALVLSLGAATVPAAAHSGRAAAAVPSGWPQFAGNAAHTGDEPGEVSVDRGNVGQLSVAWTAPLPSGEPDAMDVVVTGGAVYTADGAVVTALNAATGTQLWQVPLPGTVTGTPSVQNGLVLVGYNIPATRHHPANGFVVALNSATGALVWKRAVGGVEESVTALAGRAFAILGTGQVEAIGLSKGYERWESAALPGCSLSAPSVADGFVVVGGGGAYVSALHASNGKVAWEDTLNNRCGLTTENWLPAISQGTVYAGLLNGMYAISLASGAVEWRKNSLGELFFGPSLTAHDVIVSMNNSTQLVALSRSDGSPQWRTKYASSVEITQAAVFGSLAWALLQQSGEQVKVIAIGGHTGDRVFATQAYADQDQGFPPVVDAGHVYFSTGAEVVCLALPGSN